MTVDVTVKRFVEVARRYCVFVETADGLMLSERIRDAAELLAELYQGALQLPPLEPTDADITSNVTAPRNWPGFGRFDSYWEVFDPYELADPVGASLTDDVLDVYLDIRRGLNFYDDGRTANGVWEWRFHHQIHWGDHAVDALRVLQRAMNDGDDSNDGDN